MPNNAEASSSRQPRTLDTDHTRSQEGIKRAKSPPAPLDTLQSPLQSGTTAAGSGSRRVRTVPPSAAFDPPTPPSPPHEPVPDLPHVKSPMDGTTSTGRRRRKQLHIKYDSSESSADSDDADDEEPPWWTFTQRGMAKMRARTMRKSGIDSEGANGISGVESGKDSAKESGSRRGSRQSLNFNDKPRGTPSSSLRHSKRGDEGKLSAPAMIRPGSNNSSHHSLLWRRSAGKELPLPHIVLQASPMTRSSSAPTSPVNETTLPSIAQNNLLVGPEPSNNTDQITLTHPTGPTARRQPITTPKRQMTAPAFPRFLKRSEPGEIHTDTEAQNVPSPRLISKQKAHRNSAGDLPIDGPEADNAIPTRPKNRRGPTARLKINFSDPMKQHFANGWPHAGTWQDAYYGYYNDGPDVTSTPPNEHGIANGNGNGNGMSSRKSSLAAPGMTSRRPSKIHDRLKTPDHSDHSAPHTPSSNSERRTQRKRTRRARRYRHALAPPTPSGLGFTPHGTRRNSGENWKEGRVGASEEGFNWGDPGKSNGRGLGKGTREGAIEEGNELSRQVTSNTMNEKGSNRGSVKRSWLFRRKKPVPLRAEEIGWKRKIRRMLFLDARVTIWIRTLNLAVVIVALAMAVRIRFDLDTIQLPGLLGSSTTLIISYSSLTALHVLTAIYREYFGKPIGLWGLRSKMLWVCLDLIFIALWSSAMSIAVNDYIATALQCTTATPWWRGDLAQSYAELIQALGSGTAASENVTPVDMISHSLGISLPAEVTASRLAKRICDKQAGSIGLALITLLLYTINMVLSLFRIFETVRRTANVNRGVMV